MGSHGRLLNRAGAWPDLTINAIPLGIEKDCEKKKKDCGSELRGRGWRSLVLGEGEEVQSR